MQTANKIHVFGGTSDAVLICQHLEKLGLIYTLSVASIAGEQASERLLGQRFVGRLTANEMMDFFTQQQINIVIDATHPFATIVSQNIQQATQQLNLPLIRYERRSLRTTISHPLLFTVKNVDDACKTAQTLGEKIFLTTGSKDLAHYKRLLPHKTIIARVLPTVEVMQSCVALGLKLDEIVALKGPFSKEMNEAMYRFYQPDLVITKESGVEGGYHEKILPCLALNIPCIVIARPVQHHQCSVSTLTELEQQLQLIG